MLAFKLMKLTSVFKYIFQIRYAHTMLNLGHVNTDGFADDISSHKGSFELNFPNAYKHSSWSAIREALERNPHHQHTAHGSAAFTETPGENMTQRNYLPKPRTVLREMQRDLVDNNLSDILRTMDWKHQTEPAHVANIAKALHEHAEQKRRLQAAENRAIYAEKEERHLRAAEKRAIYVEKEKRLRAAEKRAEFLMNNPN